MANLDSPQWKRAQQTSLWKRTLGSDDEDVKPLKESFLDARENAAFLLDKIRPDFPNLTIHDITHVDSLWTVADAIIGENYPINPLEGYVLGIAFLIHDAALSYDAVGGKEKLRNTIEWKDAYADGPGDKSEEEFKKECDFIAIRALHAENAKKLLSESFKDENGITINIHGNDPYLNHYGNLIGKIAASHHWDIDDVESKFKNQVNPMSGMPRNWKINRQKLACILRCADAGHIDDGRAPDSIFKSLDVNGVSRNHWESQNHLAQVCEDENDKTKLCITSSYPFKKEEFAAWNVAYDAVRIFDEELKKSNNLLIANHIKEFPHNGVSGASSKEDLAKYIETDDWQPCNFGVHTSNIKYLIETLGGSKLYGEENMLLVVLRELIQNARDAIHARQKMDDSFHDGKITIRLLEDGKNRFFEVEDNGIGMSMDCIKHNLLDFGGSYWKSSLSKYENPGLRSKGFKSIGKFGIGFYSVFMVAMSVEVRTKRYNKAVDDTKKIEFPSGLTLSPIISEDNTLNASVSTIVRFELTNDDDNLYFGTGEYFFQHIFDLKEALPIIVAGLDVDVYYEEDSHSSIIHTNMDSSTFDKKVWLRNLWLKDYYITDDEIDKIADSLEFIEDSNGEKRGLIGVPNENLLTLNFPSIETINGLCTSLKKAYSLNLFLGYISSCKCSSISRNEMALDIDLQTALQNWIKRKYLDNHDEIYKSITLSNYYVKMMDYCGITQEDKLSLLEQNKNDLYKTYKSRNIEIGTFSGLKEIQSFLFSGIISDSEMPDTLRRSASVKRYYSLESLITKIDTLGINNFDDIFSKFIELCHAIKLDRGEKYVAPKVWLNLMLNECMNRMIDWSIVDQDELYSCIANLNHPDGRDHLRTIINENLIDGTL